VTPPQTLTPDSDFHVLEPDVLTHEAAVNALVWRGPVHARAARSLAQLQDELQALLTVTRRLTGKLAEVDRSFVPNVLLHSSLASAAALGRYTERALRLTVGTFDAVWDVQRARVPAALARHTRRALAFKALHDSVLGPNGDGTSSKDNGDEEHTECYLAALSRTIIAASARAEALSGRASAASEAATALARTQRVGVFAGVSAWAQARTEARRAQSTALIAQELHAAITARDAAAVKALLGARVLGCVPDVTWADATGADALRLAIHTGQPRVLDLLLEAQGKTLVLGDSSRYEESAEGYLPADADALRAHIHGVPEATLSDVQERFLITAGVKLQQPTALDQFPTIRALLRRTNPLQETYLFEALAEGHGEGAQRCAEVLVRAGADLYQPCDAARRTVMHVVAAAGDLGKVELLLRLGFDVRQHSPLLDRQGRSVLHAAVASDALPVVQKLVGAGALSLNLPDADGQTPAHNAKSAAVAAFLCQHGVRPANCKDAVIFRAGGSGLLKLAQEGDDAWRARVARPALVSERLLVKTDGPKWARDADHPTCVGCGAGFGLFSRRHHCRLCGFIFCSKCTTHSVSSAPKLLHRVCDGCSNFVAAQGSAPLYQ